MQVIDLAVSTPKNFFGRKEISFKIFCKLYLLTSFNIYLKLVENQNLGCNIPIQNKKHLKRYKKIIVLIQKLK